MQIFIVLVFLLIVPEATAEPERVPRIDQTVDGWAVIREFSQAERAQICREHEGRYIAHYGQVFFVDNCRRRRVDWVNLPLREQASRDVVMVENYVIAALAEGAPYQQETQRRQCRDLEGSYVSIVSTNIFLVENCRLRQFPDWETFNAHRRGRAADKQHIMAITHDEARALRRADPMPSVIDDKYRELLTGRAGVDIIPVDEACRGIEGKDVFYYSRVYRVEDCRKRQYDASKLLLQRRGVIELKELSSEQWLSLPNGEPMEL